MTDFQPTRSILQFVYTLRLLRMAFSTNFFFLLLHTFQRYRLLLFINRSSIILTFAVTFYQFVGLVYCLQGSQILFFNNFFIKNEFYRVIYIFKNYFAIVFSVFSFSKISSIQTDPCVWIHGCVFKRAFFLFFFFWLSSSYWLSVNFVYEQYIYCSHTVCMHCLRI